MTEIWMDIPEYEGLYQVSNLGNVKSLNYNKTKTEKLLKLCNDKNNYLILNLHKNGKQQNKKLHRLVLLTFKPESFFKNAQANHINGIRNDNRLENLEWCSAKENMTHAIKTGLRNDNGENHKNSKLKDIDIIQIRLYYKNKTYNQFELADKYNISRQNVGFIVNNKAWTHIK